MVYFSELSALTNFSFIMSCLCQLRFSIHSTMPIMLVELLTVIPHVSNTLFYEKYLFYYIMPLLSMGCMNMILFYIISSNPHDVLFCTTLCNLKYDQNYTIYLRGCQPKVFLVYLRGCFYVNTWNTHWALTCLFKF